MQQKHYYVGVNQLGVYCMIEAGQHDKVEDFKRQVVSQGNRVEYTDEPDAIERHEEYLRLCGHKVRAPAKRVMH